MKSLFLDVIPMPEMPKLQISPDKVPRNVIEKFELMSLGSKVLLFVGVVSIIAIIFIILVIVKILRNKV